MKMISYWYWCAFGCLVLGGTAQPAELGDPAPPLHVAPWLKGQPVDLAAGKGRRIFVVEFLATQQPRSRASLPFLTTLQNKFKDRDVTVVAVIEDPPDKAKLLLEQMGDQITFAVGADQEGQTAQAYLLAFKVNSLPHAFIIDQEGRIAWAGPPQEELESTLQQIVDHKYDLAVARKRSHGQRLLEEYYELAAKDQQSDQMARLAKEIEALDRDLGGLNPGEKFDAVEVRKQARFEALMREYQQALNEGQAEAKLEALAQQAQPFAPKGFNFTTHRHNLQLQRDFREYFRIVMTQTNAARKAELSQRLQATQSKDPHLLNEMAWALLTDPRFKSREARVALKLAQLAYEACNGQLVHVVDTYARALFDNGQVDEAIRRQKQAVALAKDAPTRTRLENTLREYQGQSAK